MKTHTQSKYGQLAFWLCLIVYTVICMTRNTYASAMAEILKQGLLSKPTAGLITSLFGTCYGLSQFFGGWLVDRTSPFVALFIGLIGCGTTNAAMALSGANFAVMATAWSLNGLFLFGSWPSIIKIMAGYIPPEEQTRARLLVPFGLSAGTMLSYLVASVLLPITSWPGLFWASVVAILGATVFFLLVVPQIRCHPAQPSAPQAASIRPSKECPSTLRLLLSSGFFLLLVPSILRGWLDTGFKNWLPTLLVETYGVSTGFASALSSVLLFVNLSAIFLLALLYPKRCKNLATAFGLLLGAALLFTFPLAGIGKIALPLVVALLAVTTTLTNAGSKLINVDLPTAYVDYGKAGTIAGILNAILSLSGAAANTLYGFWAEHFGWNTLVWAWVGILAVAVAFCFIAAPVWKRFTKI